MSRVQRTHQFVVRLSDVELTRAEKLVDAMGFSNKSELVRYLFQREEDTINEGAREEARSR